MTQINRTNFNNNLSNNANIYTKRTCSDNSEMYITSKLNMLYEQAVTSKNTYSSRRYLRKMLEGSNLDTDA